MIPEEDKNNKKEKQKKQNKEYYNERSNISKTKEESYIWKRNSKETNRNYHEANEEVECVNYLTI